MAGRRGQHGLWWRGLRRVQHRERSCSNLRIQRLQGGNQVGEKTGGIVVLRFQREPGDRQVALGEPLGKQSRFAEASRG